MAVIGSPLLCWVHEESQGQRTILSMSPGVLVCNGVSLQFLILEYAFFLAARHEHECLKLTPTCWRKKTKCSEKERREQATSLLCPKTRPMARPRVTKIPT